MQMKMTERSVQAHLGRVILLEKSNEALLVARWHHRQRRLCSRSLRPVHDEAESRVKGDGDGLSSRCHNNLSV